MRVGAGKGNHFFEVLFKKFVEKSMKTSNLLIIL